MVTLTSYQRDHVWREARLEFDFQLAEDSSREEILTGITRLQDFVRLFDDLGWERNDDRLSYPLTMPGDQRQRIAGYLEETAANLLYDETTGPFAGSWPQYVDQDLELLHTAKLIAGEA